MYIARRVLLVADKTDNKSEKLEVCFSKSIEDPNRQCFKTEVVISGFIKEVHSIAGVDSVDSISLALRFVQGRLADLSEAYTLTWDDGSPYESIKIN